MNSIVPCKECITRAVCQHKKQIVCGLLYRWNNSTGISWDSIRKYLPHLEIVLPEKIVDGETLCIDAALNPKPRPRSIEHFLELTSEYHYFAEGE